MERAEQMRAIRQAEDDMMAALLHNTKTADEKVAVADQASGAKANNNLNIDKIKLVAACDKKYRREKDIRRMS